MKKSKANIPLLRNIRKIVRIMKIAAVLVFMLSFHSFANTYGQNIKMNISMENASLKEVFERLEKESGYYVVIRYDQTFLEKKVDFDFQNSTVTEILDGLLKDTGLEYKIIDRYIAISTINELNTASQQQKTVKGKVTDASGASLPGVTVVVKGTTTGVITGANGNYSLSNIPENATLQFSFVGMKTQEIVVGGKTSINVTLEEETVGIEEVVAIGYGTQSKKKITSSISEVNMKGLKDLPNPNSAQVLQGRVAGVTINEDNGAPGTMPSILIHGISSINAGTGPLVVVDGFPVGNSMPQSLNPSDIEKITVLKDAASTSIYGARGSNGVILIQTLKAHKSQTDIEYNVYEGFQYVPQSWRPKVLDALQYAEYNKGRVEDLNAYSHTTTAVPQIYLDVINNPQKYGKGTNWQNEIFRQGANAPIQNHNLTIRMGNEQLKAVISGGYFKQDGVLPNSDFNRFSLRTNIEGTLTKWLKASASVSVARTENNSLSDSGNRGILMEAITASPLQSPYDANGNLIPYLPADSPGYFGFPNPLYQANVTKNNTIGKDVNATLNLDVEIFKGLHYKPQVYAQLSTQAGNTFVPTTVGVFAIGTASNLSPGAPPFVNSATNQNSDITNWGIDNLLTYDKTIGGHSFSVLLGYTAQKQTGQLSQINAVGFPSDNILNYLEASSVSASVTDYSNWALDAIFGRISYDYKGKYLADINFRREGSSKFGDNNKYGNFPSGSIGWRVSQEDFYPKNFFMNELKVRASYGLTGNSAIGDFDRFGTIISIPNLSNLSSNFNYVLNNTIVVGKSLTSLGAQNLKWETSRQMDLGLIFGFLNDRITFSADYFRKTTKDMLFNVSLPQASGFASTRNNVGEMLNQGWDFEASSNISSKDFSWTSNLNLSLLRNKVTSMPNQISKIISTYNVTEVGEPVGSLYGQVIQGIFNTQAQLDDPKLFGWTGAKKLGAYIFKDANGDGKIDDVDNDIIGDPHPHVVLGFNNSFAYKNFSLSILTTGAFGYQIFNTTNSVLYNEVGRWNVSTEFLNRWRSPDNPGKGLIPAIYYPGQHPFSNLWIENGDHIWVKNVTVSYKIPSTLLSRTKFISGLRFYLSIQNALKITNYSGWNPQVSTLGGSNPQTFGVDMFSYPLNRTYSLGANINF